MRKVYCYATALLLSGIAAGCKQETGPADNSPVRVATLKMTKVRVAAAQEYSGTIQALGESGLGFPAGGTLEHLYVAKGEKVRKGTLLASVDETSLRNAYVAAMAARRQAEDAHARMRQLHDNNSLPEMQWIEVQSKLEQAVAAEQIAKKELSDARLYAPFSGFIADKTADVGQNLPPGAPVLKLVEISQVKVKMAIPENEIGTIRKGADVQVTVPALDGTKYEGKIIEKGVDANLLSRSYDVYALVDNPNSELLPGMLCDVSFDAYDQEESFLVPGNAIQIDGDNREFVWLMAAGRASKRIVSAGGMTAEGVVVTKGLAEGDEVIIGGQQKVSEGMPVTRQ